MSKKHVLICIHLKDICYNNFKRIIRENENNQENVVESITLYNKRKEME